MDNSIIDKALREILLINQKVSDTASAKFYALEIQLFICPALDFERRSEPNQFLYACI